MCSTQITENRTALEVEAGPLLRLGFETLDLCQVCAGKLAGMLTGTSPDLLKPPATSPVARSA
jgi:hypothetical protein